MRRFSRIVRSATLISLCFLPAVPNAMAATLSDNARVDRLTDLIVEMVPFGKMFDMAAAENPKWPVQDNPESVTADQLGCLRRELSDEGYRRARRVEVAAYAATRGSKLDQDIEVLEKGASTMMGKAMLSGAESKRNGQEIDAKALFAGAHPEQLLSFLTFANDEKFAPLRELSGIGETIATGADDAEARGKKRGAMMAAKYMLQAMSACDVPVTTMFGK